MEQYIKKSALVAEIEDWRNKIKKGIFSIPLTGSDKAYATFEYEILGKIIDFLDTFEVKEVDLEKEIDNIWNPRFNLGWDEKSLLEMNHEGFITIAKHFFELGLKAQKGEL